VNGAREAVSAFDTYSIMRWLLLAAAVAPIILLYIVVRDHELSWPRGEMTAVIGIIAFGLTGYVGIIDRPGEPPSEISLGFGWYISLLGTIMIAVGGAYRASTTERPRKPPGVF
jgi:archaellum biogenesis protein FlaJ (TadC family)